MSGELFKCGYGAILLEDVEVLESCLRACCEAAKPLAGSTEAITTRADPVVRVVEIGMHDGNTARGIERFVNEQGCRLEYVGIDTDDGSLRPRYVPAGGRVIVGKSTEVFGEVSGLVDLVWVDGCHCAPCVMVETLFYAPKVRVGGFLCYHDTNPRGQFRSDVGYQYHGPTSDPHFGLAVRRALEIISFPWPDWTLVDDKTPPEPDRIDCGTMAFQRTLPPFVQTP